LTALLCIQLPYTVKKNCRKYSIFILGTHGSLNLQVEKFSVPLTSESVTSGQAGGVFRQLCYSVAIPNSVSYASHGFHWGGHLLANAIGRNMYMNFIYICHFEWQKAFVDTISFASSYMYVWRSGRM
jgi:hypothetical protein